MYVWVYMYEYICMSIYVWVSMHEHVCCILMFAFTSACLFVCMYVWMYVCAYVCVYVARYKYVFIYMYVWMYMHVMLCYHWVTNHCGCCYYNEQDGWTALMLAATNGHGAIVTYLVEQGANKELQNEVSIHLLRMIMMMILMIMMMMIVHMFLSLPYV